MNKGYEINKKDIDTVLNILKRTDPENATPKKAIEILENLQAGIHVLGHVNPETLIKIQKKLKKQDKKHSNNN